VEKAKIHSDIFMQEAPCFTDEDCPNIGYRCYGFNLFQLSGPGMCHCWSSLGLYGDECQAKTYSKIGCCLIFSISLVLFLFSVHYFFSNSHRFSFNAFSTTFLQNTLGLLSSCVSYGFCIDRVFYPGGHAFWKIKAYYYFASAAVFHGICSALNISLMWIEISGFRQLKIVQNVQSTKNILLGFMISLYIELLVIGLIVDAYRFLQFLALFYVLFLVVTFLFGSSRMRKVLHPRHFETYTDQRRANQSNDEIQRIFSTTMAVCLICVLFLVAEVTYLVTFSLRIPALSFFTFHGFEFCIVCLEFVVLWHLQGRSLFLWCPLPCVKAAINNRISALENGHNRRVVPLKGNSPSQPEAM